LLDLSAKVGREDIFKPSAWNNSVHETNNHYGVTVVNFGKSTFINALGPLLMGKRIIVSMRCW